MKLWTHRNLPATRCLPLVFALVVGSALWADEVKHPADPMKYTGPGSCAAPACHGGVQPRSETAVLQNEYSTWLLRDKHAQAYSVLLTPVGQRMGRLLKLDSKPEHAQKCLLCHALSVPAEKRAKSFDTNEGVSCESCHGPASGWLGPHTEGKGSYERALTLGMVDTRNLMARTERCLGCHLGDSEKFVDHEMIAAGHPDLYFELESFSSVMPRHWKEPPDFDKDPWRGVKTMGTGQAVQLREALRRLSRRAQSNVWPEYAELQCFACHHSLTAAKDSWRQERGYAGRRPGNVPWDESRYVVFRQLVHELDAGAGQQLDAELGRLFGLVSSLQGDRAQISSLAANASGIADRLAHRIATAQFDQGVTLRLMQSITANAESIAGQDERAAEQAAMILDSLFVAYTRNAKLNNQAQVKAAIESLFPQFNSPSSYDAPKFARQLNGINALLR
jgi:hypothetical protein